MLSAAHGSRLHEDPSADEQSCWVYPRAGSGQETCGQCMMGSGTSQGEGGGTLVPCRGNGGRGGTESGVNELVSAHPRKNNIVQLLINVSYNTQRTLVEGSYLP